MRQRPKVVVIGGGLAGIAACEILSRKPDRSFDILLLEARPHLGGRVGSYFEKRAQKEIDISQHLFLSCYDQTLALLDQLGTRSGVVFFDRLFLPLWDKTAGIHPLDIPGTDNPVALINGLLQYEGLPFLSRLAFLNISRALPKNDSDVDHLTAHEFLIRAGQPEKVIDRFWELVILSATNLPSRSVSAAILVRILKESLLRGGSFSRPGYNAVPLSELFVRPAMNLLKQRGVEVRLKAGVTSLSERKNRIVEIQSSGDSIPLTGEDHLISAVPPWAFEKMAPVAWQGTPILEHISLLSYASPILTVHLQFNDPVHLPVITGFHESEIHWLFNKDAMEHRIIPEHKSTWFDWSERKSFECFPTRLVSATVSGASRELLVQSEEKLEALCLEQIRKIDRENKAAPCMVRVVRDRFATPILGIGQSALRSDSRTALKNLWMAGDTTDTGLPATMEGAVRSGYRAGSLLLESLSKQIPGAR